MDEPTDDVAETLFGNRSEPRTYRVTLDDERTFEVTPDDFEYDPAEGLDEGYLRFTIEFSEVPDLDLKPDRFPTELGELAVVEMDDGWGTPILRASVQYAEDGELVRWEYPTLGTIATVEEVDDDE